MFLVLLSSVIDSCVSLDPEMQTVIQIVGGRWSGAVLHVAHQ